MHPTLCSKAPASRDSTVQAPRPTASDLGDAAAGGLDLLLGRRAERVRGELERDAAQVAAAENLDRLVLADRAGLDQLVRADLPALREQLDQALQVDHLELHPEPVAEALELGQAHVDRHLPTLEGGRHLVPGLGALGAAARRLALGALAPADPG